MGKGDVRSAKGKRVRGSYGKSRNRKKIKARKNRQLGLDKLGKKKKK